MKKKTFKHRLNRFKYNIAVKKGDLINWWFFKKKLLRLWWADAPKSQIHLEKGAYWLKKGAVLQVGQPVRYKDAKGKTNIKYIRNLTYNFRLNKITHLFALYPIKGFTEQFEKRR